MNDQTNIITQGLVPLFLLLTLVRSVSVQPLDEILVTPSRISQPSSEVSAPVTI